MYAISAISSPSSSFPSAHHENSRFQIKGRRPNPKILASSVNGSVPSYNSNQTISNSATDVRRHKSNLESLFCYDKPVPEEIIEKPIGLSLGKKDIANNPRCVDCEVKGVVLCKTCSGSGLYVDSILESQGIIVKVRCLGCGGTGNIMCSECGGRGHL